MEIKECSFEDIIILAEMNKYLIEDEKSNNSMDIIQIKNRMYEFLNGGYIAYLFIENDQIIGYALCDMTKEPKYLRQFFIKREERRKHYGKIAFIKLLEKIGINEIEIDVLQKNDVGLKFWQNIGFKEQWIRMKFGEESV
jgi:GNAT superfamily N-acetyltransferase